MPLSRAAFACSSRVAGDGVAQQAVELDLVAAQPLQRGLGLFDQGWRAQMGQLLGSRGDLGQQLAAPVSCADIPPGDRGGPDGQGLGQGFVRPGPNRGRGRLGERPVTGDHRGIQAIGLGQQAGGWDCQEFRVRAMTMGRKEPSHGTTQSPGYP